MYKQGWRPTHFDRERAEDVIHFGDEDGVAEEQNKVKEESKRTEEDKKQGHRERKAHRGKSRLK